MEREPGAAHAAGGGPSRLSTSEPSLGELLRRLGEDAAGLVREEVSLAKLELGQAASGLTRDLVRIGIALGLAAVGGLALTTFAILVIGRLLDGAYWAGALIVGVLMLAVGGLLARRAIEDLRRSDRFRPDDTIDTLREDARWARREAQEFKREIRA